MSAMTLPVRVCRHCSTSFFIEPDDLGFYEKMHAPAPNLCPECRFKRRALFRNEMTLYNRTCAKCSKRIVTAYSPDSPYTVYCLACWDSDAWDPARYAQEYDAKQPFFQQFYALMCLVPKRALAISSNVGPNINSDYTNVAGGNKNSYMVFNTAYCEEAFYSRGLANCKQVLDMYFGVGNELCYEGVNVNKSNQIVFGHNVNASFDSLFLLNASGCQHCFASVNVRNGKYVWFNEQLKEAEYKKRLEAVRGSYRAMQEMEKKFEQHSLNYPRRENNSIKTIDSSGDYLFECKNVHHSFEVTKGENSKYLFSSKEAKDCYDILGYGYGSDLLLDCCATGYSSNVVGTYWAEHSKNIGYSFFVRNCSDCFGCDGLKNKNYCLLNKQYTREEYATLVGIIKKQMMEAGEYGVFMPAAIAPFAYNETVAQDNMPMTKEEAVAAGYRWQDNMQQTTGKETMKSESIPDNIRDVPDTITKEILACLNCARNYKITPNELVLYRKMVVPLPRLCFYCRHTERLRRRGPMKIYDSVCAKCGKDIKTTFNPKGPEIVYCEECYNKEVA